MVKVDPELKEIGKGIAGLFALARLQGLPVVTSYLEMALDELARAVVERQEEIEEGERGLEGIE